MYVHHYNNNTNTRGTFLKLIPTKRDRFGAAVLFCSETCAIDDIIDYELNIRGYHPFKK